MNHGDGWQSANSNSGRQLARQQSVRFEIKNTKNGAPNHQSTTHVGLETAYKSLCTAIDSTFRSFQKIKCYLNDCKLTAESTSMLKGLQNDWATNSLSFLNTFSIIWELTDSIALIIDHVQKSEANICWQSQTEEQIKKMIDTLTIENDRLENFLKKSDHLRNQSHNILEAHIKNAEDLHKKITFTHAGSQYMKSRSASATELEKKLCSFHDQIDKLSADATAEQNKIPKLEASLQEEERRLNEIIEGKLPDIDSREERIKGVYYSAVQKSQTTISKLQAQLLVAKERGPTFQETFKQQRNELLKEKSTDRTRPKGIIL